MTSIEEQAAIFGLLADPTRLKLLRLLFQQREPNALCVNALAYQLEVTQSAVSQHLRVLKSAGLVKGERRGYRVHYFINQEALIHAHELISDALHSRETATREDTLGKLNGQVK
jgi:ArsR family transcriptional regulator, arsenate/arsenite/antimonite-responsive transcriptional repressor